MKSQIYCATEQFLFHHITTSLSISFSHLFFEFSGLSTSCSRMFSLFVSALHYSVIHSVMEFDSKKKHFLHTHTHTYTNPPHWFNGFTEFHSLKNFNCVAHGVCASVVCVCVRVLLYCCHLIHSIPKKKNYTSFAGFSFPHAVHRSQTFGSLALLQNPYRYTTCVYTPVW